ncbi:GLPGLI family protein [Winogradskyella pacifica]|uniref:GLPGLI family protein n=1 Tax=Winogradskyella pacifica TaxID=664642 RepID=A0A3D9N953_9FLAO|nr:GLPGLI family protein [Winogradskyella pacifica]REE27810.1 GLPGLI family protein [Winogradskyella pacifica]
MKQLLIIFLWLILVNDTNIENFQSGEVTYSISMAKEIIEKGKANPKLKRLFKNASDVEYQLLFNKKASEYKKIKAMQNDANSRFNITEIEAGGKNIFYFDLETKENIYSKSIDSETYLISRPTYAWKITKESIIIGEYNCLKAILLNDEGEEMNIFAWFTTQIPLGYGPKNFNSLPGLILRLNSGKAVYNATKIKLLNKNILLKKPQDGIKLTYKEFKNRFKGFFDKN